MFSSEVQTILLATTNRKKLEEMRAFLRDFPLRLLCLSDFPSFQEVDETGMTFSENASIKALDYARQFQMLAIGEDSGLCCDVLDGAPGVYSARFAGTHKSDAENNAKLLRLMKAIPDNCRGAHYTSAIALASPDRVIGVVEGEVHGLIYHEELGTNGFGYDPLFYYPPFNTTFGNVSAEMKNSVSHRRIAMDKFKVLLSKLLGPQGRS